MTRTLLAPGAILVAVTFLVLLRRIVVTIDRAVDASIDRHTTAALGPEPAGDEFDTWADQAIDITRPPNDIPSQRHTADRSTNPSRR